MSAGLPIPSDQELAAFRRRGDPLLDERVSSLPFEALGPMLGQLFRSPGVPASDPRFSLLLEALPHVPVKPRASVTAGQGLLRTYGPEVLLILGCYGLPAAYAAADGVQVVYRARRLADDTERRLAETAQMLINVSLPDALEADAVGDRTARKVRVLHALIRRHVGEQAWPEAWGTPINQEDLAGTLLTFSVLVLDGLRKIGVQLGKAEVEGYLALWAHLGSVLGIDPRLIATDPETASALARAIGRRQFRATPEGRELTQRLIAVNDRLFPIRGYAASLMRFFLDDEVFGVQLSEVLDLPSPTWTRYLVRLRAAQKRTYFRLLARIPGAVARRRAVALHFTQRIVSLRRTNASGPFEVPPELLSLWTR